MQQQDKELFHRYEIKNSSIAPRFYKFFGIAAAFNLLAILVLGQTNLLTQKGCDSPFVGTICRVIDTAIVGKELLGTDSEFVSKDYENNQIEDADVTFVDVSGKEPPLNYPEGYFALANPESQLAMNDASMSGFSDFPPPTFGLKNFPTNPPVSNDMSLMSKPQVLPPDNKGVISGGIPDSPFGISPNPIPMPKIKNGIRPPRNFPRPPKMKNYSPPKLPKIEGDDLAENKDKTKDKTADKQADKTEKPVESEAVKEIEINKKPFEDLGDSINEKIAKKEIDLTKPFLVVMDGTITGDGKLDPKKSKYVKLDGDEKMVNVAKDVIEAVGNSGFLSYLKNLGVDRVNFTMVQDEKQIFIKIISDQKTSEKAGTTASSFNTMISAIKVADTTGIKKLDDNSKTLLNNSKVTNDGKNFVLDFAIPKQDAQDIIVRELKKQADKKAAQQQPNSNADLGKNANANVVK